LDNPKIAIITDRDASLPKAVAEKYGILQVPITVNFGEQIFRTGIDIDDAALFSRVDRDGALPITAAPAPGDFSSAYQQAFESGADSVLCFCVSSEIGATYVAAITAQQTMPERDIHVVDTSNLTMGQGFMVIVQVNALAKAQAFYNRLSKVVLFPGEVIYAVLTPGLSVHSVAGMVGVCFVVSEQGIV